MKLLHRGQFPLCTHSSREQSLQNVCPQGIKAAPLCLTMQTQQLLYSTPGTGTVAVEEENPVTSLPSTSSIKKGELSNPNCRSFSDSNAINDILTGCSGEPSPSTSTSFRWFSSVIDLVGGEFIGGNLSFAPSIDLLGFLSGIGAIESG